MKHNTLTSLVWIVLILFLITSCEKDETLNGDNNEDVANTAEWSFIDGSGYSSNGTTYVKNKEIEEGTRYVDIRVNVTKAGTYNLSTETINGYKYSGTGELLVKEEGAYQAIKLWASGTPINSGTFEFEITFGESSATFNTYVVPLDAAVLESKIVIRGTYNDWDNYGKLTAYQAATGEIAWSKSVSGWISQADVIADTIFINNSEYLEARNINTGELFWSVTNTESSGYYSTYMGITHYKGVLYCSTSQGHVLAFKSSDGSLVHDFDLETTSVVSSIPVVVDDVMFVGHTYLWAFNIDGSLKWKYTLPSHSRSGATVDNGVVYISTDHGELCAVNISDGTLKWQYTVGTDGEECPTVSNGKVYSGNMSLYCLDATSGQLIWQKDNVDFEWDSPNVFNNTLYVGGNGVLHSINAETGETIWEKSGSLAISSEIAACESFIVFNSAGLVARYAENGETLWSNVDYQSFDNITLNPLIYDKVTQEVFLPSIYGNKK